jgi:hypothetical protein
MEPTADVIMEALAELVARWVYGSEAESCKRFACAALERYGFRESVDAILQSGSHKEAGELFELSWLRVAQMTDSCTMHPSPHHTSIVHAAMCGAHFATIIDEILHPPEAAEKGGE